MSENKPKDRPLECSSCSRKISVKYSEVYDSITQCLYMCAECPFLNDYIIKQPSESSLDASKLQCGECLTTLREVQRGEPLGCPNCYQNFEMYIQEQLAEFLDLELSQVIHSGRKPQEITHVNPAMQILALKEALNKTLSEENYEQAAWIRDKIQDLKKRAEK